MYVVSFQVGSIQIEYFKLFSKLSLCWKAFRNFRILLEFFVVASLERESVSLEISVETKKLHVLGVVPPRTSSKCDKVRQKQGTFKSVTERISLPLTHSHTTENVDGSVKVPFWSPLLSDSHVSICETLVVLQVPESILNAQK